MSKIFISYSRQSESIVKNLVNAIEQLGNKVWFDQELSGGQLWWEQILERIRDCDIFVFAISAESLKSTACKLEYKYADELGKPVLPILIAEGVSTNRLPPQLVKLQFVDYRGEDLNAGLRLARSLNTTPKPKPLPDPLPLPPGAPISYLGTLAEEVETTATLNYVEQNSLLTDLRKGLEDPETTNDTYELLRQLRKRRDLYATIGDEIDQLMRGAPPLQSRYRGERRSQFSINIPRRKLLSKFWILVQGFFSILMLLVGTFFIILGISNIGGYNPGRGIFGFIDWTVIFGIKYYFMEKTSAITETVN